MIPRIIQRSLPTRQIRCIYQSNKQEHQNKQHPESSDTIQSSREIRDRALKNLLESSTAFIDTKPQNEMNQWATLPYVEGTVISKRKSHELDIDRPKIDPRDTSIILFPGDEAQFVGMAKSLECIPAAKDLFDYASDVVKYEFYLKQIFKVKTKTIIVWNILGMIC